MEQIILHYESYAIQAYYRKGDGREKGKVVFLHGGGLDNAMMSWQEVIAQMDSSFDLYAFDLPGYGASDKPDLAYSIPLYVSVLRSVFEQLGIQKASLAGLSLGGGIAIAFSLKYPEMVETLTVVDSLGLYEKMPFHAFCRWFVNSSLNAKSYGWFAKSKKNIRLSFSSSLFGDKSKITDRIIDEIYDILRDPETTRAWQTLQRSEVGKKKLETELAPHLSKLKMPVLIVNGEKDSLVPLKCAQAAQRVIPGSRLHIMKGCRHWAQKERPEEFVLVFQNFLLQSLSAAR